jgi:hypothetical protein
MDAKAPLRKKAQRQRRKQEEKAFADREPPRHQERRHRPTKEDSNSEVSITSSAIRGEQELIGK